METCDDRVEVPINDWKRLYKDEMYNRTKNRNEIEARYKKECTILTTTTRRKKRNPGLGSLTLEEE